MGYLLSMDGGGSKTAWLLTTEEGVSAASFRSGGCSHPEMGLAAVLTAIHSGIEELLIRANCSKEDIISAAFGVPCYGEYPEADKVIYEDLHQFLEHSKVTVCNDVELGFAGSLCLEDGIHLVAGTGAIVIGRNAAGQLARSNGWHPSFSDEGSGYWLGNRALSLFTKQADHRVTRGALYWIIREAFDLQDDMEIAAYYDRHLADNRKEMATIQLLLYRAAIAGDVSAVRLFEAAALELFVSIRSVYETLAFSKENHVKVSYSGGLFYEGNYILGPLTELANTLSVELVPPYLSPVYGGILLAAKNIDNKKILELKKALKAELEKEEENGSNQT